MKKSYTEQAFIMNSMPWLPIEIAGFYFYYIIKATSVFISFLIDEREGNIKDKFQIIYCWALYLECFVIVWLKTSFSKMKKQW